MTALSYVDPRPSKQLRYTPELRAAGVRRVEEGQSIADAAAGLGVSETALRRWCMEAHRALYEATGRQSIEGQLAEAEAAFTAAVARVPDAGVRAAIERAVINLLFATKHLGETRG